MKKTFCFLLFPLMLLAQEDQVAKQAALNSAQADLEQVRKVRDRVVAERWQKKRVANLYREDFNLKYEEKKDILDRGMQKRSRLMEEVRAVREELEKQKEAMHQARLRFSTLSQQGDKVESFEKIVSLGSSLGATERIGRLNRAKHSMELLRDRPDSVVSELLRLFRAELSHGRSVEVERGDLLFPGNEAGRGLRLRLGGVWAGQIDSDKKLSAVLLPAAGERGRIFAWRSEIPPEDRKALDEGLAAVQQGDSLLYLPVDILLSTSLGEEFAAESERGLQERVAAFLQKGGPIAYLIVFLLFVALSMSAERVWVWLKMSRTSQKKLDKIFQLAESRKLEEARKLSEELRGSTGRVVQAVMRLAELRREDAEKAVEEILLGEVPALEKRLSSIRVLGNAAPLLGLLGTVYGMIELFRIITLYGTSDPKLLAGGISVALITTELGLACAIPVQFLHNFLTNRVDNLVNRMEAKGLRLLNILWKGQ